MVEALISGGGTGSQCETLEALFERSRMCMAKLDNDIKLVTVNTDFSRQFGYRPNELDGRCFTDLLHNDVQALVNRQFNRLLAEDGSWFTFTEPAIAFRHKDSTIFSGELTGFTVRSQDSGTRSLMTIILPQGGSRKYRSVASHKLTLTEIEVRIIEGVALGVSTVDLGSMLYLSRSGVTYYVGVLMHKLRVKSRPALVSKAYSIGLLSSGWPPRVHPDYLERYSKPRRPGHSST